MSNNSNEIDLSEINFFYADGQPMQFGEPIWLVINNHLCPVIPLPVVYPTLMDGGWAKYSGEHLKTRFLMINSKGATISLAKLCELPVINSTGTTYGSASMPGAKTLKVYRSKGLTYCLTDNMCLQAFPLVLAEEQEEIVFKDIYQILYGKKNTGVKEKYSIKPASPTIRKAIEKWMELDLAITNRFRKYVAEQRAQEQYDAKNQPRS